MRMRANATRGAADHLQAAARYLAVAALCAGAGGPAPGQLLDGIGAACRHRPG